MTRAKQEAGQPLAKVKKLVGTRRWSKPAAFGKRLTTPQTPNLEDFTAFDYTALKIGGPAEVRRGQEHAAGAHQGHGGGLPQRQGQERPVLFGKGICLLPKGATSRTASALKEATGSVLEENDPRGEVRGRLRGELPSPHCKPRSRPTRAWTAFWSRLRSSTARGVLFWRRRSSSSRSSRCRRGGGRGGSRSRAPRWSSSRSARARSISASRSTCTTARCSTRRRVCAPRPAARRRRARGLGAFATGRA